ncbi:recombinase family protein [Hymenobacter sp. BT683]|uniref:Recombinase family protein n=1 Tax=Hymenobacter jeongseonensis TaxID=2791027 RepID=A0ABS0ILE4_9BACT|nr:recombinase family protein [Hymenobacter jeongseonensis]MBF9239192.1 recombinase family protein [Hymenobacter jeongseonensis]
MKIGYARVSTRDQNLELQLDALTQAGCELIYQEKASGALAARVELDKLLLQVRPGDTVYIYKLDRLGRSLKHLLDLVADLQRRGIGLISLTDAINTHSAQGRLVLNLFASLAEFERELIRERTLAGLAAARARGRVGGRKPGLSEEAQRTARAAELLYKARELSVDDMARSLRVCKVTFYKYLRHRGVSLHAHPLPSPVTAPA